VIPRRHRHPTWPGLAATKDRTIDESRQPSGLCDGTAIGAMGDHVLRTERLVLRFWRDDDLQPWAQLNADPEVRQYIGPVLTFEQASAWALAYQDDMDRHGFGYWALEVLATGAFIGFAGLHIVDDEMPFSGVELGWRLARSAWGHGYATEAARAASEYAFDVLNLPEVLAVANARNLRAQAVMRRIGMTTDPADDFDDDDIDVAALRRHVLYRRLRRQASLPTVGVTDR
jgi:RimJ/RimL family protein N-acetyltransferase